MNCIRNLSIRDKPLIKEIVDCHKMIFSDSSQNELGDWYLMRSFYWFLTNNKKRGILIYKEEKRIIGFVTMRHSDDVDSFIRYIYKTVIWCFILKPTLLLNFSLLKKILNYQEPNKSLHNEKYHLELVSIGVLPSFTNKGIGRQLLKAFENYAKNKKISLVKLNVLKDNKIADRFYSSSGWIKKENNFGDYALFEKYLASD